MKNFWIIIILAVIITGCSEDKKEGNKFNSEGTMANPVTIEVDVVHKATVSGDAVTSTGFNSYYVFTAPADGSYQVTVDNMDMEFPDGGGSNNDKTLFVSMAHVSVPYEEGTHQIDYEVYGNTPCKFELIPVRKDQKYVITITNLTRIDSGRGASHSYSKQFDLLVSKYKNISGSKDSPNEVSVMIQSEFTSIGQWYFYYPDYIKAVYSFSSSIYDISGFGGVVVSTIKVDVYKNSFDAANIVSSQEGNIGDITVDLSGWDSGDTPYFNVYSPDNQYWGLWSMNRTY